MPDQPVKKPNRTKKRQIQDEYTQRRSQGGAEGAQAPLSHHNIDVYFFNISPTLKSMGCIAKYSSALPQGVETHLLSNQAVMNFRVLRNIEAPFA